MKDNLHWGNNETEWSTQRLSIKELLKYIYFIETPYKIKIALKKIKKKIVSGA